MGEDPAFEAAFPGETLPGGVVDALLAGLLRERGGEGGALGRLLLPLLYLPF